MSNLGEIKLSLKRYPFNKLDPNYSTLWKHQHHTLLGSSGGLGDLSDDHGWNLSPPKRAKAVGYVPSRFQPLLEILEFVFKIPGIFLCRHQIRPGRFIHAGQSIGFWKKIHIDQIGHRFKHRNRIRTCLLRNPLKYR
jgi:hypothetical protein